MSLLALAAAIAVISGCGAEADADGIYICRSGHFEERSQPELLRIANGEYDPEDRPADIAEKCFAEGERVGMASLACAIVEVFDRGDPAGGTYRLLYTDENGVTSEISVRDELLMRGEDEIFSLRDLARIRFMEDTFLCPVEFTDDPNSPITRSQ